jgi:hypothetical protein
MYQRWMLLCALAFAALLSSCGATSFKGQAKFPGGAPACFTHCQKRSMQMENFVYLGAYSSACVCGVVRPSNSGKRDTTARSSASAGAVAAVMMAERERVAAAGALGGAIGASIAVH